jgi:hypothetical protein
MAKNKFWFTALAAVVLVVASCSRTTHEALHPVNGKKIDIATHSVSEFEFVGTIGMSGRPNILYSDILAAAKAKYGEEITVSNLRFQNIRRGFTRRQEVLVDVYRVKQ